MKSIKIKQITPATDGSYLILLGNGQQYRLASKKKADHFLVETSKYLTHIIFELNEIYISSFSHYRRNQWYFFSGEIEPSFYADNAKCIEYINLVEQSFNAASRMSRKLSGNYLAFKYIANITHWLNLILDIIQLINIRRSQTAEKYTIEVLQTQLKSIEARLTNYRADISTPQNIYEQNKKTA